MVLSTTVEGYAVRYAAAARAADNDVASGVKQIIGVRVVRFTTGQKAPALQPCTGDARGKIFLKNGLLQALSPQVHPAVSMDLFITDCLGQIIYTGHSEKPVSNQADASSEGPLVKDVVATAYSLITALSRNVREKQQPVLKNLLRYGIGLTDDEKTALFSLAPSAGGAVSFSVAPGGTAASAGLRTDDLVTTLNGYPLTGDTQAQLSALVGRTIIFDLEVRRGPKTLAISFQARNLAWYRTHPDRKLSRYHCIHAKRSEDVYRRSQATLRPKSTNAC